MWLVKDISYHGTNLHSSSAALISKEFTEKQNTSSLKSVNQSIDQQKCSRSDISRSRGHMSLLLPVFSEITVYIFSNIGQYSIK